MKPARLLPATRRGWSDFHRALHRVPPPVLHGIMAASLLCVLVSATANAMRAEAPAPAVVEVGLVARVKPSDHDLRTRCEGCGFVESIRAFQDGPSLPVAYEFTVRMRDGTIRTSIEPDVNSWRAGDRIIIVGGDDQP